jgi:hypothetical protein
MQPSITPSRAPARVAEFLRYFLVAVVGCSALSAQYATIAVDALSRPMYQAVGEIQKLTSIPINYEDLQYYFATDLQAPDPTAKVVVPKGGSFSVNVPVNPASGRLSDGLSVATALNAVIAAAQAVSAVPGTFRVDSSQAGAFFIEPTAHHSSSGSIVPTQPVLDTPVSISLQEVADIQALDAILQQVSQKTGFKIADGMGTLGLAGPLSPKVSITATSEPAKFVLARLLGNRRSYIMLFDPNQRYYGFNIRNFSVLQPLPPSQPYSPPPLVPSRGLGPGYIKKNN